MQNARNSHFFSYFCTNYSKTQPIAMTARLTLQLLFLLVTATMMGQSGLNKKYFNRYWRVESESPE